jgi:ankyrin repeat protein
MILMNKIWFSKNLLFVSTLLALGGSAPLLASDDADNPEVPKEEEVVGGGSSKPGGGDDPDGQGIKAADVVRLRLNGGAPSCQGIPEPQSGSDQDRPRFKRHRNLEDVLLTNMEAMLEEMKTGDWENSNRNLNEMVTVLIGLLKQIIEQFSRDDSQFFKKRDFFRFCLVFLRQYLWHMPKELLSELPLFKAIESISVRMPFKILPREFFALIGYIRLDSGIDESAVFPSIDLQDVQYADIPGEMLIFAHAASEHLFEFCKKCLKVACFKELVEKAHSVNRSTFFLMVTQAVKIVQVLIDTGANLNALDLDHGYTSLHHAAQRGSCAVVQALINARANINAQDRWPGRTPLHHAVDRGDLRVVQVLINAGADVNAQDNFDRTPLHDAVARNNLEIVAALINAGADVNAIDGNSQTPLNLATDHLVIECLQRAQGVQEAAALAIFLGQVQLPDPTAAGYGHQQMPSRSTACPGSSSSSHMVVGQVQLGYPTAAGYGHHPMPSRSTACPGSSGSSCHFCRTGSAR